MYIHDLQDWPNFKWDQSRLDPLLDDVRFQREKLFAELRDSGFSDVAEALRAKASLEMLTQEVVKSSEIEGEMLDPAQVRSSIARKLGLPDAGINRSSENRNVDGIVNVVFDASQNWSEVLTAERLGIWHKWLFPLGINELGPIIVGRWREGPIDVVSKILQKPIVHFRGPSELRVPAEMEKFLDWFENTQLEPILKAGIAHLYYVTIHPFDDGNGRIARAITDRAMARADKMNQRFYSMSAQIRIDRNEYYDMLEKTQKGTLDITDWLAWFLGCLARSIDRAHGSLEAVIIKSRVLRDAEKMDLNDRQKKVLGKLLDGKFGESVNTTKYKNSAGCSKDSANRDLTDLVELGILERSGAARNTSYSVAQRFADEVKKES